MRISEQMSAIKQHELWDIVHGDDIQCSTESGEQTMKCKRLLVSRQRPSQCQVFAESENTGSISSSNTQIYPGKISSSIPNDVGSEFTVKTRIGDEIQELKFKSVRSESSECIIS
jgi:hypothetical protein